MNARIASTLEMTPSDGTVQQKTDRLMSAVLEAVHALTPKARPSPYAKRWWTADLTQLRQIYTYWRNRARAERREGQARPDLEDMAKGASKQYHDAIRHQKKKHWNDFLADNEQHLEGCKIPKARRRHGVRESTAARQSRQNSHGRPQGAGRRTAN